jgi:hypothetical protein
MSVNFAGELHLANGTADKLLQSIGHPGLGMYTNGSMPVAEARRLIEAHTGQKHEYHDAFAEVIEALEAAGAEMLEWS